MYLNDCQRAAFYNAIGLDARKFDQYVIRKTNQSSQKLFPIILDVENPVFFQALDECAEANLRLQSIDKNDNALVANVKKLYYASTIISKLIGLYFLKAIPTDNTWTAVQ